MDAPVNRQEQSLNFDQLVQSIQHLDSTLRDSTVKAINRMTTMRNWLIGAYIVEYEQNGVDRAKYGVKLIETLSTRLGKGFPAVALRKSRIFYKEYPQIINYIQIQPTLSVKLLKAIQPTLSVESIDIPQPLNRPRKARKWLNMHLAQWTDSFLFQHISCNSLTANNWKNLLNSRERRDFNNDGAPHESQSPTGVQFVPYFR